MAGPGKSRHENEAVGLVTLQVCCVADEIGSQGLTWIEDQGLRIKDQALGVATGGGVDRCQVLFTEEGEAGEEEEGGGGGARRRRRKRAEGEGEGEGEGESESESICVNLQASWPIKPSS